MLLLLLLLLLLLSYRGEFAGKFCLGKTGGRGGRRVSVAAIECCARLCVYV